MDIEMPVDTISQIDRSQSADSVSLRDYTDSRIAALDSYSKSRYSAMELEIKRIDQISSERLLSVKSAHELYTKTVEAQFEGVRVAALLSKESLNQQFAAIGSDTSKATSALDKRLEGMNEFREQMNDMASKFIMRTDVEFTAERYEMRIIRPDLWIIFGPDGWVDMGKSMSEVKQLGDQHIKEHPISN